MRTEILCVIDRSGSMEPIANDAINGFNRFIKDQRENDPQNCRVTFAQFDDVYDLVYLARPVLEVPLLNRETFKPRGWTALLDAIGRTLEEQGRRIHNERWAELVIVVILTDGGENHSKVYRADQVRTMTRHAETNGWSFVYLGANQDAFSIAQHTLGINLSSPRNFTATYAATGQGMNTASQTYSAVVSNMRSFGTAKAANGINVDKLEETLAEQAKGHA